MRNRTRRSSARGLFLWVGIACVSFAAAGLWAGPPTATAPASTDPSFRPVQSVEQLMHGQKKLHDEIKDGILDKAWQEAGVSAWLLAELANVNHYQSKEAPYRQWADQMAQQCVDLAKVLRKRDAQKAKDALAKVSETCQACHDKYRKKD